MTTNEKLFNLAFNHKIRVGREIQSGCWYLIHPETQIKLYAATSMELMEQLVELVGGSVQKTPDRVPTAAEQIAATEDAKVIENMKGGFSDD